MKNKLIIPFLFCCMLLTFTSCGQNRKQLKIVEHTAIQTSDEKSSVTLNMDGKTYTYDDIDRKYSRVEMNNDILIKIVQKGLPSIDFGFPASDPNFTNGSFNYTVGLDSKTETLYLSFFDKNRKSKNNMHKRIVFRSGQIEAQRDENSITINFDGKGSPMLIGSKKEDQFPISGTMKLTF